MNRRGFLTGLAGIFAAAAAPAIVQASSIMRVKPIVLLEELTFYEDIIYIDQSRNRLLRGELGLYSDVRFVSTVKASGRSALAEVIRREPFFLRKMGAVVDTPYVAIIHPDPSEAYRYGKAEA